MEIDEIVEKAMRKLYIPNKGGEGSGEDGA
jgi:hypothetical protein